MEDNPLAKNPWAWLAEATGWGAEELKEAFHASGWDITEIECWDCGLNVNDPNHSNVHYYEVN